MVIWASRFAHFVRLRRAIRSITFAPSGFASTACLRFAPHLWACPSRYGGSAAIPLAPLRGKYEI